MKTLSIYIGILGMLLLAVLPVKAESEAEFRKLSKTYTLRADGSQELRVQKELTLFTHAAMNGLYGETFIVYDPEFQELTIHESYTRQKDGTVIKTPSNALVEVLPSSAANAPAYNHLKEMVVVHTGLELGATIYLDYSIVSKAGYLPELDVCCPVKELSPVKEFIFRLNVPAGKSVRYELLNASAKPVIAQGNGMKSFIWTLKDVAPRPYAYPSGRGNLGLVQAIASGMMPVFVASTWPGYTEAVKYLQKQFAVGNTSVVEGKVAELTQGLEGNPQAMRNAIANYMAGLYQLGHCNVSLQDAGYRLRPASEVITSAYGTQAELVNLDVTLQRAAGLEAEVAVCALRPSVDGNRGLATVMSLVCQSKKMPEKVALTGTEEACLQPFMTITDLQGKKLMLESYLGAKEARTIDTLEVKSDKLQELADGWGIVPLSDPTPVHSLYAYAGNTSISEKILLPRMVDCALETIVRLPEGMKWSGHADKEISNACGKVVFSYKAVKGGVKVTRSIRIDRQLQTPANYKELYALLSEWRDTNNHTLVVKKVSE
ncbi:DUF3857 domain-containing protein [Phocaeicola coprophilus]|jgi:hypothetical protein|uniref:DUF3857 domain-containing protein n=2 Tax=Phocaeicola coprophilus TaxID=387090 RepID=S0FEH4_9BACT|nr:DUF3857 domain-containing protein [Phocaeicola coprophilus]EEF77656.1 hypothetical protein BACCOPRO_03178 [Phocaeicola coprophilus DSM 18228 = JCM 13818]QRO24883.1 DUF3857 domain-containing protein [Phocaeicola coprophilus]